MTPEEKKKTFLRELATLINRLSLESFFGNHADWVLAELAWRALAHPLTVMRVPAGAKPEAVQLQPGQISYATRVAAEPVYFFSELLQALGLLTTLAPNVVINVDDPLAMAKEIERYVTAELERLTGELKRNESAITLMREGHARELDRVAIAVRSAASDAVDEFDPTGRAARKVDQLNITAIITGVRLG